MSMEIAEVTRFLKGTTAFGMLSDEQRSRLSQRVEIRYVRAGEEIIRAGSKNRHLFLIRSGSVELRLAGKELTARLDAGAAFAYPSLLRGGEVRNTACALQDTLLYTIEAEDFVKLRERVPDFKAFFARDETQRIRNALIARRDVSGFQLDRLEVEELIGRSEPVSCSPSATVLAAVGLMNQHDVSTLAVCEKGALRGIFTDKDLRNRVVGKGHALDGPVSAVMTSGPKTLSTTSSAAEAMALMASGGFRHVPLIAKDGTLAGILSATDILSAIGSHAIDTGMMIAKARNEAELIEAARCIPDSFAAMVNSGLQAAQTMRFVSALGEAVHRRAVQLAEHAIGEPPCAYAFVVFGSLAREEQLLGSDQDNGFVISDEASEADLAYFLRLGERVCDLLNDCGFVYCEGGIMAKNADQRLTASGWRDRYKDWIARPTEDRILRATIFFDMRPVHGDEGLVRDLHQATVTRSEQNPLFISYLARDAQRSKVPLGIFNNLVLKKSEDGQKVFDAKGQAIMPIVDIARAMALGAGLEEVGTIDRLKALAKRGRMHTDDAQSLEDAMILVNEMRIAHQARQVSRGEVPNNRIAPADLSPLERDYLKDAFSVVRTGLDGLRRNLAGGIA
ncbi:MAG: DUF294 nucleotidyltransferase-like domain-containing protein [Pseudomonadota bacterium]